MTGDIDIEQARIWALFGLQDERFRNRFRSLESRLWVSRFLIMICTGFWIVGVVMMFLDPTPWGWVSLASWTVGILAWGLRWRGQSKAVTDLRAEYSTWYQKTEVMHAMIWPERAQEVV